MRPRVGDFAYIRGLRNARQVLDVQGDRVLVWDSYQHVREWKPIQDVYKVRPTAPTYLEQRQGKK